MQSLLQVDGKSGAGAGAEVAIGRTKERQAMSE